MVKKPPLPSRGIEMKLNGQTIILRIWPAIFVLVAVIAGALQAQPQEFRPVTLALKPPMGWNDWYQYECKVEDAAVRANADALVSTGMKAAGYIYVNLDDCWQGKRDTQGIIHPNSRFPDMKALADYVHGKGLKFGLYSSPGPKTCAGYEGSFGHEDQDAKTYARWGVDFLKYDWCSASQVYKPEEMQAAYRKMFEAIQKTGRPMVYSLCQYGLEAVWRWGASVGGNMWRTTDDIGGDGYVRVALFGFIQDGLERYAGPGHWNDPDILQIGLGKMSPDEEKTQMTLWCMLAAPLLAGNDLAHMSPETLALLTNPEVISVDQDSAGIQGHRVWKEGPLEVWVKPLADGSKAVAFFNRGLSDLPITASFADIGVGGHAQIRDLWAQKELGSFATQFTAKVPHHGAAMIKVKREN
jgi:alpha-galactosidase